MSTPFDIGARAEKFLQGLANAKQPIKVDVVTPQGQHPVAQQKSRAFANALRAALPGLVLMACVPAQTQAQNLAFSHNGAAPVTIPALKAEVIEKEVDQALHSKRFAVMMDCFGAQGASAGWEDHVRQAFAAMRAWAQVGEDHAQLDHYATKLGMHPDVAVAAYCVNPTDWKGEIDRWQIKARRVTMLSRADSEEQVIKYQADQALAQYTRHQSSTLYAMGSAALYQGNGQFDRSIMHKTSGDWVGAAASIIGGLAEATGSRDTRREVYRTQNKVRNGQNVIRRIENLNRYQGANKWNQIGSIIGQAGRTVDLGEALKRIRPQPR